MDPQFDGTAAGESTVVLEAELLLPGLPPVVNRYPAGLPAPKLHARTVDEYRTTLTFIEVGDIAMHVEMTGDTIAWHLHSGGNDGPPLNGTPWDDGTFDAFMNWTGEFVSKVENCWTVVDDDLFDAIAFFETGATFAPVSTTGFSAEDLASFAAEDFLTFRVTVTGETEPQVWAGAGNAWHLHDENRPGDAALLWERAPGMEPTRVGTVIMSPETGLPGTFANPHTNWGDVGVAEHEAMDWLLREHRNCLWASTVHSAFTEAVLNVLAGVTEPVTADRH